MQIIFRGTWIPQNTKSAIKYKLLYRAKLCRAKFSSGETIRRAKFSSLNEKFVTFARRKVSPNKSKSVLKWSTSEPSSDLSYLDKMWLYWWAKLCQARLFVGRNFRHFSKNLSLSPDKVCPIRYYHAKIQLFIKTKMVCLNITHTP